MFCFSSVFSNCSNCLEPFKQQVRCSCRQSSSLSYIDRLHSSCSRKKYRAQLLSLHTQFFLHLVVVVSCSLTCVQISLKFIRINYIEPRTYVNERFQVLLNSLIHILTGHLIQCEIVLSHHAYMIGHSRMNSTRDNLPTCPYFV
jgi:hypothetical protein